MLKKLFGFRDIEVTGNMHVQTLQNNFEESFKTKILVYKPTSDGKVSAGNGAPLADPKSTLASNCPPGLKISTITIRKGNTVGEIEKAFAEKMNLGVKIMSPGGNYFPPHEMKLADVSKVKENIDKEKFNMALTINGKMKVKTLKESFKKEFGVNIRVYNGSRFADDDATLASIRSDNAPQKGVFEIHGNTKVGNIEKQFVQYLGIKIQIENAAGGLADNNETLSQQKK